MMNEKEVAAIWQSGAVRLLAADSGQRVHVLYPGRRATRPGCDFQDAVLMIGERRVCGDVEVHVSSSLWEGHGHRQNPRYAGIVLHVVLRENGGLPALTLNGRAVPTVALDFVPGSGMDDLARAGARVMPACVYAGGSKRRTQLDGLLVAAGLARFAGKVEKFRRSLQQEEPGQVIYTAIARSLGYAANADAFVQLAGRLSLSHLLELSGKDARVTEAVLIGTAGLLPGQRGRMAATEYESEVESLYRALARDMPAMGAGEWNLYVRPANHPVRRLVGLAALAHRYAGRGLYGGIREMAQRALNAPDVRVLEQALIVGACGYWEGHYDFGLALRRPCALLGRGRAAEVIVNSVLPCLAAAASLDGDRALEYGISGLYRDCAGAPGNEITRHMQLELRLTDTEVRGACRQQGLLHLYHSYCREKHCGSCPVFTRRN